MTYRRKIRFEYFEVVCRRNDDPPNQPDRVFDLALWIDQAGNLGLVDKTYDYSQEKARLDRQWYDEGNRVWFLNFMKLRATNIPNIAKEDQEAEPMELQDDEYIGEEACAIYDRRLSVLMLQRNFHSLGPKGIEYYLNKLWDSDEEKIFLRPIAPLDVQALAQRAPEYRNITVRFADIRRNNIERPGLLKNLFDNMKQYGAVTGQVNISMGYERGLALDNETVRDTIEAAVENRGIISKAELGLKKNEDSPMEILDLFEEKMHDFIYVDLEKRTSIVSEFMALKMAEKYTESRGRIIESLRERDE